MVTPNTRRNPGVLYNLHFLRVIAALSVVYFHITSEAGLNLRLNIGSRGVDVFFVISGFIIAHIGANSAPTPFFLRRLIRIVPFYWAASLFVFAVAFLFPTLLRSTSADLTHLGYSLAFLPRYSSQADGMFPTLILGWSLNFEMYFYVLFTISLIVSRRLAPLVCCASIGVILAVIQGVGAASPALQFYGRPITLEFVYGVMAYYCLRWLEPHEAALSLRPGLKWLLIGVFIASLGIIGYFEFSSTQHPRYIVAGIPAFFTVLSALLIERIYGIFTTNQTIYLLGESSYIVYLVHPYIIYAFLRVVVKNAALSLPLTGVLIVGLIVLTSVVSIAIHLWFEKPVMGYLRRRFVPVTGGARAGAAGA